MENHAQAVHKLDWYALRWKIETFFSTLKTGCRVEDIRLATADRLANCIALCCIVAWRVSWLTMLGRGPKSASPAAVTPDAYSGLADIYEHPDFRAWYETIEPGFADFLIAAMKAWAARPEGSTRRSLLARCLVA